MTNIDPAERPRISWDSVNEVCAFSNLDALIPMQRIVYLSYWYMSEVLAGGHSQYFTHRATFDQREVIDSLRAVGADEQATILAMALKVIDGRGASKSQPAEDYLSRARDADLSEFDEAFEKAKTTIAFRLVTYVNSHESEFVGWARRGPSVLGIGWTLLACLLIPAMVAFLATGKEFHGQLVHRVWSAVAGALLGAAGFTAFQARQWFQTSIASRRKHQKGSFMLVMLVIAKWTVYLVVLPALLVGILLLAAFLM